MNEIYIVNVYTTLPEDLSDTRNIKFKNKLFLSFEKAKKYLNEVLSDFAFNKNYLFDGKGKLNNLHLYISSYGENEDDEETLGKNKAKYIEKMLFDIFSGKQENKKYKNFYLTDYLLDYCLNDEEFYIYSLPEASENSIQPIIRTNMFSMKEDKDYYFYIIDDFGQDDFPSLLFITLNKTKVEDSEK